MNPSLSLDLVAEGTLGWMTYYAPTKACVVPKQAKAHLTVVGAKPLTCAFSG